MNNIIILKNLKNFTKKISGLFSGFEVSFSCNFIIRSNCHMKQPLWGKIAMSTITSHYVMGVNKLNPHYV